MSSMRHLNVNVTALLTKKLLHIRLQNP